MEALDTIRRRLADAARSRTANGLLCIAADLTCRRLADHVAAGTMTADDALAVALAAEDAAHSVAHVSRLEIPHDRASL